MCVHSCMCAQRAPYTRSRACAERHHVRALDSSAGMKRISSILAHMNRTYASDVSHISFVLRCNIS